MAATVLVVDDIDAIRWLTSRQLKEGGYEVLEAASGTEALLMLAAPGVRVSLVITDMSMPQMDGKELATAIAHLPTSPQVLHMSGYPPPEGLGGHFLPKPFTHEQLISAVRKVLAS